MDKKIISCPYCGAQDRYEILSGIHRYECNVYTAQVRGCGKYFIISATGEKLQVFENFLLEDEND